MNATWPKASSCGDHAPGRADADASVRLLRELVEIPSVSRDESRCVVALVSAMNALGIVAEVDGAGNASGAVGDASPRAREILLLGHIDTVPGDVPVRIEADRLYGRGAVDAKGSLATFVCAAAAARLPSGVRVRVIGAVEEEAATSAGARFAARTWRPDACIIGEPSGADAVTLGYKGRLIATARLATPCSHSAGPEPTAPELAAVVWQRLLAQASALRPDATRVFDQVQARLRSIRSASDGMRDRAEFTLGFRIPPGVLPGSIESLCHASTRELPCECEWAFSGPEVAHVADRTNPVVRALAASIRAQGSNPGYKLKTGTSDMNVVGPIWNCPIAAYGPGDSSLDHTPDEHIVLPEYLRAIRILTHALETLGAELAGAGPADQS